nr:MAG TPA: hypothetical protein [Caudoviricetes sp.]
MQLHKKFPQVLEALRGKVTYKPEGLSITTLASSLYHKPSIFGRLIFMPIFR